MLCAISKLFELLISKHLLHGFLQIITPDQHGFIPNRSIETNLVCFMYNCHSSLDKNMQVDCVYTDFHAAFDKIDHHILLAKLLKYGVSSGLVLWLKSFISNRSIKVNIGASFSSAFSNSSGVPQGSVLGPLLFVVYINDIVNYLPDACKLLYADDLKIFLPVNNLADCHTLQNSLLDFNSWCARNHLFVNVSKCSVVTFTRKKYPVLYDYKIAGSSVPRSTEVRDLGVLLDSRLTLQKHFDMTISKALRVLGFVIRVCKDFNDPFCLKSLYCSLVRPIIEFACVVWSPRQQDRTDRLESIQRKLTKHLFYRLPWSSHASCPAYRTRCLLFGLESLQHRRMTAQCIFLHKTISGSIDAPFILSKVNFLAPGRQLRPRQFLRPEFRTTMHSASDPIIQMMDTYNKLGNLVDFNMTVNHLRKCLRQLY